MLEMKPPSLLRAVTFYTLIALLFHISSALKHHLVLSNDYRMSVQLSSFGYLLGGRLDVIVQNLTMDPDPTEIYSGGPQFGFLIIRTKTTLIPEAMDPQYQLDESRACMIESPERHFIHDIVTMTLEPKEQRVSLSCFSDSKWPQIRSLAHNPRDDGDSSHSSYIHNHNKRATLESDKGTNDSEPISYLTLNPSTSRKHRRKMGSCPGSSPYLPLIIRDQNPDDPTWGKSRSYSFNFTMFIDSEEKEGLYTMGIINCRGKGLIGPRRAKPLFTGHTNINMSMLIYETNYPDIYLSAGLIPLPQMYFILSVMFFLVGCIWVNFIARQKDNILKIHRLMTILIFAKSTSLLLHGINYHFISMDGQPVVTWAYLYYATRFVKGALFFITLPLIGSGWSFVRHILSEKDKKIIIVVVALQIIAHIAEISLDESNNNQANELNEFWSNLFVIIDLVCCILILLPITWSVKHLEEASRTDGKAAINLKKLVLFKRFYVISTIYIYITRIVTLTLSTMLTFKYFWVAELVEELVTLAYFITTGHYFQPMPTNPYLLLSSETDFEENILFSVDAHNSSGTLMGPLAGAEQDDRNTIVVDEEGKQPVTRRQVEEMV